jgi:hypothetical protein
MTANANDAAAPTRRGGGISPKSRVFLSRLFIAASLLLCPATAMVTAAAEPAIPLDPPRQAQAPEPLCFCWNDGRKIAEGHIACIRTNQGRRMALCGRVINMMSWQVTENPCPES